MAAGGSSAEKCRQLAPACGRPPPAARGRDEKDGSGVDAIRLPSRLRADARGVDSSEGESSWPVGCATARASRTLPAGRLDDLDLPRGPQGIHGMLAKTFGVRDPLDR